MARPEDDERRTNTKKRSYRDDRRSWPKPQQIKAPPIPRTGKAMHHPAFRVGEIKHGKS